MKWYDLFSTFYDLSVERAYRGPRCQAVRQPATSAGAPFVLDLACGTGQNFPLLFDRYGDSLRLLGVDASAGMLARARRRVSAAGWQSVRLVQADATTLDRQMLFGAGDLAAPPIDLVVCTLGLSALPEWRAVFERAYGLLRPGGWFLIMDVWAQRRVPQTFFVELIARADLRREVWRPLETISEDFELRFLEGSPHFHGGRLFVATGRKSVVPGT